MEVLEIKTFPIELSSQPTHPLRAFGRLKVDSRRKPAMAEKDRSLRFPLRHSFTRVSRGGGQISGACSRR